MKHDKNDDSKRHLQRATRDLRNDPSPAGRKVFQDRFRTYAKGKVNEAKQQATREVHREYQEAVRQADCPKADIESPDAFDAFVND